MRKGTSEQTLTVIARSPFEVHFEGEATSVSATNAVGEFDILPGHADFFSMLSPGDVLIEPIGADLINFPLRSGIMTVRDNNVMLFVNI